MHQVGSIHRNGQQNEVAICDAHGPCQLNDSKHTEASFSTILTDTLYLRVAQMPRSPDLAIFVLTTDNDRLFITPCACARGNKKCACSVIGAIFGACCMRMEC